MHASHHGNKHLGGYGTPNDIIYRKCWKFSIFFTFLKEKKEKLKENEGFFEILELFFGQNEIFKMNIIN